MKFVVLVLSGSNLNHWQDVDVKGTLICLVRLLIMGIYCLLIFMICRPNLGIDWKSWKMNSFSSYAAWLARKSANWLSSLKICWMLIYCASICVLIFSMTSTISQDVYICPFITWIITKESVSRILLTPASFFQYITVYRIASASAYILDMCPKLLTLA